MHSKNIKKYHLDELDCEDDGSNDSTGSVRIPCDASINLALSNEFANYFEVHEILSHGFQKMQIDQTTDILRQKKQIRSTESITKFKNCL